jgi:hypothetical protein
MTDESGRKTSRKHLRVVPVVPETQAGCARAIVDTAMVIQHFAERRAAIAARDLIWRYDVGVLAHKLRYDVSDDWRPRPLLKLSSMLDIHPDTLRYYARVAEVIAPTEFAAYVGLRNRHGMGLTWSHLEELAKCRSPEVRRRCAQQASSEELSVRELAKRIRSATKAQSELGDGVAIDRADPETR